MAKLGENGSERGRVMSSPATEFFVNLCPVGEQTASDEVTLFGRQYPVNYKGYVDVDYEIDEDDRLSFSLPELDLNIGFNKASEMNTVLVRVCGSEATIMTFYNDIQDMLRAQCCNSQNQYRTCRCYGLCCSC